MISVTEAIDRVLATARPREPVLAPLSDVLGLVLAEDVRSDIDSPPHDKALMDGYAVRAADVKSAPADLAVVEQVTAGATPTVDVAPGQAIRIMTGAPIPTGADAVVMVERTELVAESQVRIHDPHLCANQNIMRRATSMHSGQVVLQCGTALRPIEIGLLAEVGRAHVLVHRRPVVAVLSTGNELVPADCRPEVGQIRNSNGPMLQAMVDRVGATSVNLGIGRDSRDQLTELVRAGLEHDVLVLSGGVSAGVLDLVPSVLDSLGVRQVFHRVHLKPGKPVWFGVLGDDRDARLVFGLPGNPVSSLVCFELFVRPAIAALAGRDARGLSRRQAKLAHEHRHRSDRPTYFPSRMSGSDSRHSVQTLAWKGSADLCTLAEANCLVAFPPGERAYATGDDVDVLVF